jgi:hypothetical protein
MRARHSNLSINTPRQHVLTIGDFIVDYTSRLPAGEAETAKRYLYCYCCGGPMTS